MINILKELKDILNIKKKYYILNVLVAKGHGALALEYSNFIDKSLEFNKVETIISNIEKMIESRKRIASLIN
jgi:hypothetical protein